MPKIIHWNYLFFPHYGGIATHIDTIVKNLPEYDFEIITNCFSFTKKEEKYSSNTIVKRFTPVDYAHFPPANLGWKIYLPYSALCDAFRAIKQKKYLKSIDFALLHMHDIPQHLLLLDVKLGTNFFRKILDRVHDLKNLKSNILLTRHSLHTKYNAHLKFRLWERYFVSKFENIIFVDKKIYDFFEAYFSKRKMKKNIWYIPNPIDTKFFSYAPLSGNEKLRVGFLGRLDLLHGEQFLIKILERVPDFVEFHCIVSTDTARLKFLMEKIKKKNVFVSANVEYEKIPNFLSKIDVLFNPFLVGYSCGRAALEAMSVGRPIIMFKGYSAYPLVENETGFLVEKKVSSVIGLFNFLHKNKSLIEEYGKNATTIIKNEFSVEKVIPKIKRIYKWLVT